MKKIFLSVMMAMMVMVAMAQNEEKKQRPQEMTPETRTEQMVTKLSLSADQNEKVLALNTEYADLFKGPGMKGGRPPKQQEGTDNSSSTEENKRPEMTDEMKAKMEERRTKEKEYETKLKAVLSEDQYTNYEKTMRHHGGPHKQEKQN